MISTINLIPIKMASFPLNSIVYACLFGLCVLTFTSCGDEEDEVVGTWDLVEWNVTGCPDSGDNFNLAFGSNGCIGGDDSEICTTITQVFSETGTYRVSGTITIDGDVLVSQNESGTWERSGGALVLCDSSGDCDSDTNVTIVGNRATVTAPLQGCTSAAIYQKG